MKRSTTRTFGREEGQAVLLVVVAMGIFLIGALGLAIDGGQMFAQRQMAQAAADAAAQAGIMSMFTGTNATSAHPFGTIANTSSTCTTGDLRTPCVYAQYNGFGTAVDTVTLSFPTTVAGVTLSSVTVPALTVTVQRTLTNGFIRMIPGAPATSIITAKATAGLVGTVSPSCIYVLDPSAAGAFQATNGAHVTVTGCSIQDDSSNVGSALLVSGSAVVTASAINVVGGASISGGGSTNPTPTTFTSAVADPFLTVPSPPVGACDQTNYSKGTGTWTLDPGVYCNGISLHNAGTFTFNPGTYIVNGGQLSLAAGTYTGSGVMVYLTGTNLTYGSVAISNGANVTLSAQTSGPYLGLLFYQDRSITSARRRGVQRRICDATDRGSLLSNDEFVVHEWQQHNDL